MTKKLEHPHVGHRQRLKDKVRKVGLEALSEHEIIELLLTYTIPQKDTNELAHTILNTFGSIANSIDANYNDLLKIKGVGEETALFFKVMANLMCVYKNSKGNKENVILNSTSKSVEYYRKHYFIGKKEEMKILCLSKKGSVVSVAEINGQDDTSVNFNIKDFVDKINKDNVDSIVVFHTHPNGGVEPSREDIFATQKILNVCVILGIKLSDHIILNETSQFSFKHSGLLNELENNILKTSSTLDYNEISNLIKNGKK